MTTTLPNTIIHGNCGQRVMARCRPAALVSSMTDPPLYRRIQERGKQTVPRRRQRRMAH